MFATALHGQDMDTFGCSPKFTLNPLQVDELDLQHTAKSGDVSLRPSNV
jgi:hypothetical protein